VGQLHRILRPGGRVVLTTWEPGRRGDERLDPRIRVRDLGAELANAGFIDVCVCEQAEWYEQERRLWRAVAAVDDPTDAAVRSLRTEARAVLETFDQLRRVLVTGRKPG
jgi:SAM-dependent methyltransferase